MAQKVKLTAYVSHGIQGRLGSRATDATMQANCDRVRKFIKKVRAEFGWAIDFYLPADHEEFVHRAFSMGLLSIDEILVIDCDIVKVKDIIILYIPDSFISNGCIKEMHRAGCFGKPNIQVTDKNWKTEIANYLSSVGRL